MPMPMHPENFSRRLLFGLLIVCFLACAAARTSATATVPEIGAFPSIQATSLDSQKLHLPQDFSGKLNLVVISFAREQQHQVDTWIPVAREIQAAHSNFSYYELSTMSSENILYRWWFDAALRSNTADKDMRRRILTAYVNEHKFLASLHIRNQKRPVAVLVDRTGKVFWRGDGSYSAQDKAELLSVLATSGI